MGAPLDDERLRRLAELSERDGRVSTALFVDLLDATRDLGPLGEARWTRTIDALRDFADQRLKGAPGVSSTGLGAAVDAAALLRAVVALSGPERAPDVLAALVGGAAGPEELPERRPWSGTERLPTHDGGGSGGRIETARGGASGSRTRAPTSGGARSSASSFGIRSRCGRGGRGIGGPARCRTTSR